MQTSLAEATVRGLVAQARSQRFKLAHAIEDVDNQVALIRQRVATWEQSKASLGLAQQEFDRAKRLLASKVVNTIKSRRPWRWPMRRSLRRSKMSTNRGQLSACQ